MWTREDDVTLPLHDLILFQEVDSLLLLLLLFLFLLLLFLFLFLFFLNPRLSIPEGVQIGVIIEENKH